MIIVRKLKTARQVLRKYGLRPVLGLLRKNIATPVIRIGRKLDSKFRRAVRRVFARPSGGHERLRILYVTTTVESENGQTIRYRVFNRMESLRDRAETRFELLENGVDRDRFALKWADLIVLMRVDWSERSRRLIETAKELSVPIVFDIDDVIFIKEYADLFCRALNQTDEKTRRLFRGEFADFEKVFQVCPFATASTEYIAGKMREMGKTAYVIHNGFNAAQQRIAGEALRLPKPSRRYIVYMSGTKTHDRDLMQAIPALTRIVREYDDVYFRLIGYFDDSMLPPELTEKTETAPFMSWKKLMRFAAENTINIAPLDTENPFCHAKSELKYFEAAIAGVPTVASPTDTFRRCIVSGVNGLLASGDDEWYAGLKALLDNPSLYSAIRASAMREAQKKYSPQAIAAEAMAAYRCILPQTARADSLRPQ